MNQDNENLNEHTYKSFADEWDKKQNQGDNHVKIQEKPAGPKPDIATKAELDKLAAERNKHVPTMDYSIGGSTERDVHASLQQENDKRIEHLQERLGRMQGKPKEAFDLAQLYAEKEKERNR